MSVSRWAQWLKRKFQPQPRARHSRPTAFGQLRLEQLEDRNVPATTLTLNPMPATLPEGSALVNFNLGTVSDPKVAIPQLFAVQVDWGDGTPATAATLTPSTGNTFTINGSHAYTDGGAYLATVTVVNLSTKTPTITSATENIDVTDPDLKVTALPIQLPEGQTFSGPVATISDPGSNDTFLAMVDWGDGSTPTMGTVTGANGTFTVSGSHTYTDDGNYTVTVSAIEPSLFQANLNGIHQVPPTLSPGTGTVTMVLHPDSTITIMGSVSNLIGSVTAAHVNNAPAGQNGPVATDADGNNIDYTDGQTGTNVTFPAQNFTVTASFIGQLLQGNLYTNVHTNMFPAGEIRGQFAPVFTGSATGTSTAAIAENDLQSTFAVGVPTTIPEGQAFQGLLAAVTDGGNFVDGQTTATINWGDGTTTTGTLGNLFQATLNGAQQVPPLATPATGTANIVLSSDQTTINYSASWVGLTSPPTAVHLHNGAAGTNGSVAQDANMNNIELSNPPQVTTGSAGPQTFSVTSGFVNQLQTGNIYTNIHDAAFPNGEIRGQFAPATSISGAHTYADEGLYTITITFSENDSQGNPIVGGTIHFSQAITVTDADTLAPAAGVTQPMIGTPAQPLAVGTTFSGPVGIFSDVGYASQLRNDLTANINWGDGSSGLGTITQDPTTGLFTVSGQHQFKGPGTFGVVVTLADDPETGVTLNPPGVLHTVAIVGNNATMLQVTPLLTPEDYPVTLTATLTDPNAINPTTGAPNPASAYNATINWGDGIVTNATVTGSNGGPYTLTGTNTYHVDGTYPVTVSVTEPGILPVPLVTAATTATVADDGLMVATTGIAATEGQAFTGQTAAFIDAGAVQVLNTVPSTGTGTGDVNPYGVAIVPPSFPATGLLQPGDTLVANFNNVGNVQGTGTTLVRINAEGQSSTFFTSSLPGLSTALGVLQSGFVIVGNVPNDGNGNVLPGSLQVLDNNGNPVIVPGLNNLVTDPWDLTINDQGSTAQVYVSNTSGVTGTNGNVIRIDLQIQGGTITVQDEVTVASGYATRLDANAFVVGPGGLAFDPASHTLYVASQAQPVGGTEVGSIFAVANADTATTSSGTGTVVYANPAHLHGPIGLVLVPNGDLVVANSDAVNAAPNQPSELVEITKTGQFVGQFSMDPNPGGTFGLATGTIGGLFKFAAVDDNAATLTTFDFVPTSPTVPDFNATINWGDGTTSAGTITFSGNGTASAAGGSFTVNGSHTYADEGTPTVSVMVTENGVASAFFTALTSFNEVPPGGSTGDGNGMLILSANGTSLTFSSQAADFSAPSITSVQLFNAPAGQNASSVATDAHGNPIALTVPAGTTTFGSFGPQTFSVTPALVSQLLAGDLYENIDNTTFPNGAIRGQFTPANLITFPATVADADVLVATGTTNLSFPEGSTTASGVVATFTDTGYPTNIAGDFTATINWGDGSPTTTGTIAATGGGNFTITAGHTYAAAGSDSVTVTIQDTDGTANAIAHSTVAVTSVTLTALAVPVTGTEATAFTGAVATFTTPNLLATASQFTATVLWGDLTQSPPPPVTITGGNGSFTVSSSHTYLTEGPYTFTVHISENAPGTATATAIGTATLADADAFTVTVTPPAGPVVVGTLLNNVQVATFADTGYPSNVASDLSATITWGDNTTSMGTITALGNGNFQVKGSHRYTVGGNLTLGVTVKDIDGTATASASAPLTVLSSITAQGTALQAAEGGVFTATVATFTDSGPAAPASSYTATIAWGDGATTVGVVTGSNGSFTVTGTHTYAEESAADHPGSNPYAITVAISHGGMTATANSTATVAEVPVIVPVLGTAVTLNEAKGVSFTVPVTTFIDPAGPEAVSDYSATIAWGDNTTSTGTITLNGSTFTVTGTHTYQNNGSFHVVVTINHEGLTTPAALTVNVTVPLTAQGKALQASEGAAFTATVATFTDSGPAAPASSYTATIAWGDGATTVGVVTGSNGSFTVTGTHTYAEESAADHPGSNPYAIAVTISHGSLTAVANSTATVAEVPVIGTAVTFAETKNVLFTTTVATFTDPGGPESLSDYMVTINWGDGTSNPGPISLNGSTYTVSGTHTYLTNSTFNVTVAINHEGLLTTVASKALVPGVLLGITSLTEGNHMVNKQGYGVTGQTLSFASTFTDALNEAPHTALFAWGDGTTSPGTVGDTVAPGATAPVPGTATASHVYTAYGTYTVTETVTNKDGVPATATLTVNIVPYDLQPLALNPATGKPAGTSTSLQLVVGGTSSNDNIQVHAYANNGQYKYNVQVQNPSNNYQTTGDQLAPASIALVIVYGQNGNDQIHVNDDGPTPIPSWIFVGSGNDQIRVDHGNSLIVGGGGKNQIQGGDGRNVIIAGSGGGSTLQGGNGGNVLIAGSTAFDQNLQALSQIFAEWASSDPLYLRMAYLLGTQTGGLNGTNVLSSKTITHANGSDHVQPGSGPDLVFGRSTGTNADTIDNPKNNVIVPI